MCYHTEVHFPCGHNIPSVLRRCQLAQSATEPTPWPKPGTNPPVRTRYMSVMPREALDELREMSRGRIVKSHFWKPEGVLVCQSVVRKKGFELDFEVCEPCAKKEREKWIMTDTCGDCSGL